MDSTERPSPPTWMTTTTRIAQILALLVAGGVFIEAAYFWAYVAELDHLNFF